MKKESIYKNEKGITLIILVITIMLMIIIGMATAQLVLGQEGVLTKSKEIKNTYENRIEKDDTKVNELINEMDFELAGRTVPIEDLIDKKVEENTKAKDKYGNTMVVPGGFKIVKDLTSNDVDYNYTGLTTEAGDKIPSVQDGIVVEDATRDRYERKSICMGASWKN